MLEFLFDIFFFSIINKTAMTSKEVKQRKNKDDNIHKLTMIAIQCYAFGRTGLYYAKLFVSLNKMSINLLQSCVRFFLRTYYHF